MKRPLILLEIVIALGLCSILLTVLFRFIVATAAFDRNIEATRSALYARQHLHMRLTSCLTSIVPRASLPTPRDPSLHTPKEGQLTLIFDNGIDPDPHFSGPIIAEFLLDSDKNLSLLLFPLDRTDHSPCRKEILMKQVDRLHIQFLDKCNTVPIRPALEWRTNWPNTRWDTPSLIRITLEHQGKTTAFSFALPIADPIPTYYEEASL
jgi:hypothetical protein